MTRKLNTGNGLQIRPDRIPAGNNVLPQLAITPTSRGRLCKIEAECYYQAFMLGNSVVLRNRQLLQHAKRCVMQ